MKALIVLYGCKHKQCHSYNTGLEKPFSVLHSYLWCSSVSTAVIQGYMQDTALFGLYAFIIAQTQKSIYQEEPFLQRARSMSVNQFGNWHLVGLKILIAVIIWVSLSFTFFLSVSCSLAFFKEIHENTIIILVWSFVINAAIPNNLKISNSADISVNRTFFFSNKVITNAFSCWMTSTKQATTTYAKLFRSQHLLFLFTY